MVERGSDSWEEEGLTGVEGSREPHALLRGGAWGADPEDPTQTSASARTALGRGRLRQRSYLAEVVRTAWLGPALHWGLLSAPVAAEPLSRAEGEPTTSPVVEESELPSLGSRGLEWLLNPFPGTFNQRRTANPSPDPPPSLKAAAAAGPASGPFCCNSRATAPGARGAVRRRLRANGAALPRLFSPRFPEPEKLGSGLLLWETPLHSPCLPRPTRNSRNLTLRCLHPSPVEPAPNPSPQAESLALPGT
ncbi:unnamed protein product [Rangifer tarandus platyrhynchus]|uniref:Uncharacterized protein n=2 Tax=Rangifer tarandus platyrhynchus TaxID=3082113 RepID=A0ACB0EZG5_RANTA|nr:unnamed protein product [Rangifer tarandus platyrhynchus]CAI9705648.1 unnamed protein product [Rangifer tarandus platyrhynchus]